MQLQYILVDKLNIRNQKHPYLVLDRIESRYNINPLNKLQKLNIRQQLMNPIDEPDSGFDQFSIPSNPQSAIINQQHRLLLLLLDDSDHSCFDVFIFFREETHVYRDLIFLYPQIPLHHQIQNDQQNQENKKPRTDNYSFTLPYKDFKKVCRQYLPQPMYNQIKEYLNKPNYNSFLKVYVFLEKQNRLEQIRKEYKTIASEICQNLKDKDDQKTIDKLKWTQRTVECLRQTSLDEAFDMYWPQGTHENKKIEALKKIKKFEKNYRRTNLQ